MMRGISAQNVFVTGAAGYVGSQLIEHLANEVRAGRMKKVIASDVGALRKTYPEVTFVKWDIRLSGLAAVLKEHQIDSVVHLASVVSPQKGQDSNFCYQVDVVGTEQVLKACLESGVQHIVISSSGAAYGYHADNPAWLKENDPIRGNIEFAYSYHKGLVEEMLARYRVQHPELSQTIFRVGTILGEKTQNQITALFKRRFMIGVKGSKSPFVFIWDHDLVEIFTRALIQVRPGIYNVAGDGALDIREIARRLNKPIVWFSPWVLGLLLGFLHRLGLSQYASDQVRFLQYRPVLDNQKLKSEFKYIPQKSSSETFELWRAHH